MNKGKLLENTRRFRKTKKGVLTNIYQHQKARCKKYSYKMGYSLNELHSLFLADKKFDKIYKNWVKNGYKYYDKPSIDRINANLGYLKSNIQMLTWKENRVKGDKEVSIKKYKPIIALNMNGEKIKRFISIKEAANDLKLNQGLVSMVLLGKRNHTGGYKFIYENPELLNNKDK